MAELHYNKAAEYIDVILHPSDWLRMNLERVALLEHQVCNLRNKGSGASKIFDSILDTLLSSKPAFEAYLISRNSEECGEEGENKQRESQQDELTEKPRPDLRPENNEKDKNVPLNETSADDIPRNSGDSSAKYGTNHSTPFQFQTGTSEAEKSADKEFLRLVDIFESRLKSCLKERVKLRSHVKNTQHKEREDVLKRMFELTLRASLARTSREQSSVEHCEKILQTVNALEKLQNDTA